METMKQTRSGGGFVMRFEEKKFCQIRTLAERWDCSTDRIYDLLNRKVITPWHPEGSIGQRGLLIRVDSVLKLEQKEIDLNG